MPRNTGDITTVNGQQPSRVYVDASDNSVRYEYKTPSTPAADKNPLVLVVGCTCPYPRENFPYQPPVFDYLRKIGPLVKKYSDRYGVPVLAVAGSIADEFNTRFMPGYGALKESMDHYQDVDLPSEDPGLDAYNNREIEHEYQILRKKDPANDAKRSSLDRLLLMRASGDYGKGNISVRTAFDLHDMYSPDDCIRMSRMDLVRYLVTDEGTVQYAALDIREGQKLMAGDLAPLPPRKREAVLVSYFKEGRKYYERFLRLKENHSINKIKAGDGCRVCFQRGRIAEALGLVIASFDVLNP